MVNAFLIFISHQHRLFLCLCDTATYQFFLTTASSHLQINYKLNWVKDKLWALFSSINVKAIISAADKIRSSAIACGFLILLDQMKQHFHCYKRMRFLLQSLLRFCSLLSKKLTLGCVVFWCLVTRCLQSLDGSTVP